MCTNAQQSSLFIRGILIIALFFAMSCLVYSQSVLSGFGIEIGGGHNQLFCHVPGLSDQIIEIDGNRTDLSFTPTIRINYKWDMTPTILGITFFGYDQFGGKGKRVNGYEDQLWFNALECGGIGMYSISSFAFGVGLKVNYHLKVTDRWIGSIYRPLSANDSWNELDVTSLFSRLSFDAGARASYNYQHFSISLESWFGILSSVYSSSGITENNYRILLGYTL
jgi:hypothetical protein